ncbi:MAG TPA: hypothetical protein VFT29_07070 [Gemmatimonadaceae bacterium]|nr:hypothetical protein [Gemmatimonadaceae bacterium]
MHLVDRKHRRLVLLLSGASAALAAISSALSLFNIDIYREALPPDLLFGTIGFDVMSLATSLAMLGCVLALHRGRDRFWLTWIGLQGYLLYTYAVFAFGFVLTPLYLVYVAILGLSVYALGVFVRAVNPALLRHWRPTKLPRRTMAAFLVVMATLFGVTWTSMLLDAIVGRSDVSGSTVIVLDLAFALPLLALVGALLVMKRPMGDLLAPGVFGMSAAITLAASIGELIRPLFGETINVLLTAPFLLPGAVCLVFAVLAFSRIAPAAFPGDTPRPGG